MEGWKGIVRVGRVRGGGWAEGRAPGRHVLLALWGGT